MAKFCNTSAIDAALTWVANRSQRMAVLTGIPGNLAACTVTTYICMTTMNTGIGGEIIPSVLALLLEGQ